jgi:hypothetical protein
VSLSKGRTNASKININENTIALKMLKTIFNLKSCIFYPSFYGVNYNMLKSYMNKFLFIFLLSFINILRAEESVLAILKSVDSNAMKPQFQDEEFQAIFL